jgi:hypothetical protein
MTWELRYNSNIFYLAIDGFSPGERLAGTYWIGGLVGPKASLDLVKKIKILPLSEIEPQPSS